jgi:cytochrome P450
VPTTATDHPFTFSKSDYCNLLDGHNTNKVLRQGWKKTLTLFSRGADFRKHRKMYNTSFTIAKCVAYQSVKEDEARKMVKRIIANPADWLVQIHALVISVTT